MGLGAKCKGEMRFGTSFDDYREREREKDGFIFSLAFFGLEIGRAHV